VDATPHAIVAAETGASPAGGRAVTRTPFAAGKENHRVASNHFFVTTNQKEVITNQKNETSWALTQEVK
jgi:hypothetical protein